MVTKLKCLSHSWDQVGRPKLGMGEVKVFTLEVQGQLPELGLSSASGLGCPGASQVPSQGSLLILNSIPR